MDAVFIIATIVTIVSFVAWGFMVLLFAVTMVIAAVQDWLEVRHADHTTHDDEPEPCEALQSAPWVIARANNTEQHAGPQDDDGFGYDMEESTLSRLNRLSGRNSPQA